MDARQDRQLWSSSYERDLTDVMTLQREVARTVADEIQGRAHTTGARPVDECPPCQSEAYDAYLKGVHHWYSLMPGDLDASQRYFELALEKDPNFARPMRAFPWCGQPRQQIGYTPPSEAIPKERAAALKAVELDDANPGSALRPGDPQSLDRLGL